MSGLPSSTYDTFPHKNSGLDRESGQKKTQQKLLRMLYISSGTLVLFVLLFSLYQLVFNQSSSPIATKTISATKKSKGTGASSTNPNFVFMYIDDMGFGSIGYNQYDIYGASPYINSILEKGLFFTNYYAQEECTPSRAALMTGRYPITTGMQYHLIQPTTDWGLNTTEVLLPEIMKSGGYATYGVGKWHLGHYSNELLPTARGFDQYIGYMSGEIYPFTKKFSSGGSTYYDELYMDTSYYSTYSSTNYSDAHQYATNMYRDKVLSVLENHDFDEKPMFLYVPFQAVHDPFRDVTTYVHGLNASNVGEDIYETFSARISGQSRLQYAFSLYMLDKAVESIVTKISDIGQLENTYIILASDNGGCYDAGGRNGDLRGDKGTMLEGGMKVDAFMYSPSLLPSNTHGQNYTNLFHVSDWFPTLLSLAGVEYFADHDHALDGIDHSSAILNWNTASATSAPRTDMVYSIYLKIDSESYNSTDFPFAVRNERFKLSRLHMGNDLTDWYDFSEVYDNDDDLTKGGCSQDSATDGTLTHMLYDLENDPNETTNLYYDYSDDAYTTARTELLDLLSKYMGRIKENTYTGTSDSLAKTTFLEKGSFLVPWYNTGTVQWGTPTTFFTD